MKFKWYNKYRNLRRPDPPKLLINRKKTKKL